MACCCRRSTLTRRLERHRPRTGVRNTTFGGHQLRVTDFENGAGRLELGRQSEPDAVSLGPVGDLEKVEQAGRPGRGRLPGRRSGPDDSRRPRVISTCSRRRTRSRPNRPPRKPSHASSNRPRKRFEVGLIAITDVQEAQAGYDEAVAAEILAKRNLATAKESLREIAGFFEGPLVSPENEIPLIPPSPADEEIWVDTALASRTRRCCRVELGAEIARDDMKRRAHRPLCRRSTWWRHTMTPDVSGYRVISYRSDSGTSTEHLAGRAPIRDPGADRGPFLGADLQRPEPVRPGQGSHRTGTSPRSERYEKAARQAKRETRDAYLGVSRPTSRGSRPSDRLSRRRRPRSKPAKPASTSARARPSTC